jgi:hypothetical protein
MGLGFGYASSTGSRSIGPQREKYPSVNRYDMDFGDREGCCGVAADTFVIVCIGQMGKDDTEQLSLK